MKARNWEELERLAGIERTVPRTPTQRDAERLTAQRLKGPFWRRRRKK